MLTSTSLRETSSTLSPKSSKQLRSVPQSFVPAEEVNKIMRRAHWDEDHERWILEGVQYAGNNAKLKRPMSAAGQRRPVSDYARIAAAMGDNNPRFRYGLRP